MKKSFVFAAISLMGLSAYSGPLAQYNALLSEKDHVNSSGVRLNSAAAIIRQDRANYHKFHRRDSADEWDPYFSSKENRSVMEQMIRRAGLPYNVRNTIINCTPLVHVDVYRDRLKVRVVSDNCYDTGYMRRVENYNSHSLSSNSFQSPSWCNARHLNITEQTICTNDTLGKLDKKLAKSYRTSGASVQSQREWLTQRDRCGNDIVCIKDSYKSRIKELENQNDTSNSTLTSSTSHTQTTTIPKVINEHTEESSPSLSTSSEKSVSVDSDGATATDSMSATVTAAATPDCPDGSSYITHNGTNYCTVTSPYTGKVWLDRNLGASRVCTAYNDTQCYGDYYQWGRDADGHEKSSSNTTATQATDINSAGTDFITSSSTYRYDWAKAADRSGSLRATNWSKTDGSSVCPAGYRVPTEAELKAETTDAGVANNTDAFNSFLKLPSAGYRDRSSGSLEYQGSRGVVWSASVYASRSRYLYFFSSGAGWDYGKRAGGRSVRCLRD